MIFMQNFITKNSHEQQFFKKNKKNEGTSKGKAKQLPVLRSCFLATYLFSLI